MEAVAHQHPRQRERDPTPVERNGVKSVVCLSTDKAVYPINAMGMTKALMEKTAMAMAREYIDSETTISVTRYGNVMYSRGSVIPLFVGQLTSGRSVTVTDPNMTRFLMSLAESVDLVKYAFTEAATGDLFVRKAPASTVETLLQAVANIAGVEDPEGRRHRRPAWREALRVAARLRGDGHGRRPRRLLPRAARHPNARLPSPTSKRAVAIALPAESYTSHNTTRLDVAEVERLLMTLPEIQEFVRERAAA